MTRHLTQEEERILKLIASHYGAQNTPEAVKWMADEATLWVTDTTGAMVLMAQLSNLANWRLDGAIGSDEELRRDWLLIEGS